MYLRDPLPTRGGRAVTLVTAVACMPRNFVEGPSGLPVEGFSAWEWMMYFMAAGFGITEIIQYYHSIDASFGVGVNHVTFLTKHGPMRYLGNLWDCAKDHVDNATNQLDVIIILFYGFGFGLRMYFVRSIDPLGGMAPNIVRNWSPFHEGTHYITMKDPSRYLLSINVLLAYARFINVLKLNKQLGKLLIMCNKMITDVALFGVLAITMVLAFAGCFMARGPPAPSCILSTK